MPHKSPFKDPAVHNSSTAHACEVAQYIHFVHRNKKKLKF